jgi:hypothetical protein
MRLNPKWLRAAWVLDTSGNRIGVISRVYAEGQVTYVVKGKLFVASAEQLDKEQRLSKPAAKDRKYLVC